MRRKKRDLSERAFHKGYQAGITGKNKDTCPHESNSTRQQWLAGWREGRSDHWQGYTGVSGIHRMSIQ